MCAEGFIFGVDPRNIAVGWRVRHCMLLVLHGSGRKGCKSRVVPLRGANCFFLVPCTRFLALLGLLRVIIWSMETGIFFSKQQRIIVRLDNQRDLVARDALFFLWSPQSIYVLCIYKACKFIPYHPIALTVARVSPIPHYYRTYHPRIGR